MTARRRQYPGPVCYRRGTVVSMLGLLLALAASSQATGVPWIMKLGAGAVTGNLQTLDNPSRTAWPWVWVSGEVLPLAVVMPVASDVGIGLGSKFLEYGTTFALYAMLAKGAASPRSTRTPWYTVFAGIGERLHTTNLGGFKRAGVRVEWSIGLLNPALEVGIGDIDGRGTAWQASISIGIGKWFMLGSSEAQGDR